MESFSKSSQDVDASEITNNNCRHTEGKEARDEKLVINDLNDEPEHASGNNVSSNKGRTISMIMV